MRHLQQGATWRPWTSSRSCCSAVLPLPRCWGHKWSKSWKDSKCPLQSSTRIWTSLSSDECNVPSPFGWHCSDCSLSSPCRCRSDADPAAPLAESMHLGILVHVFVMLEIWSWWIGLLLCLFLGIFIHLLVRRVRLDSGFGAAAVEKFAEFGCWSLEPFSLLMGSLAVRSQCALD